MPIPTPMNLKGILFAGAGLTASMTATALWMSNDVARMRAEVRAKEAAACAAQQAPDSESQVMADGTVVAGPTSNEASATDAAFCDEGAVGGDAAAAEESQYGATGVEGADSYAEYDAADGGTDATTDPYATEGSGAGTTYEEGSADEGTGTTYEGSYDDAGAAGEGYAAADEYPADDGAAAYSESM